MVQCCDSLVNTLIVLSAGSSAKAHRELMIPTGTGRPLVRSESLFSFNCHQRQAPRWRRRKCGGCLFWIVQDRDPVDAAVDCPRLNANYVWNCLTFVCGGVDEV